MVTFLTTLWAAISGNRIVSYVALAGIATVFLWVVFTSIKKSGAAGERSKLLNDWLSFLKREYKRRAEIDAIDTATARQRLRDRWSQH